MSVGIWIAAYEGNLDKVKNCLESESFLIRKGDEDGRTPLHWACSGKRREVFDFLLERIGNNKETLDHTDEDGWTPLMLAASCNEEEMCEALIEAGASVDCRNDSGSTALHYAASKGYIGVSRALLGLTSVAGKGSGSTTSQGLLAKAAEQLDDGEASGNNRRKTKPAVVNIQDRYGATALHRAVSRGHAHIVRFLIDNGATVSVKDKHEKTPLDLAHDDQNETCVAMLEGRE